jgi:hypothetical protein
VLERGLHLISIFEMRIRHNRQRLTNAHAFLGDAGYAETSGQSITFPLAQMNKKIFGLSFLLLMWFAPGALGQSASPSTSPTPVVEATPKPVASAIPSPSAAPIVRVKIVVRSDDAAIRTLVENSLRTALTKAKDVTVLNGPGSASLIVGVKLVPVTGAKTKSPLYAMELLLLDTPALFNALETAGLKRQEIYTLLVANELQPIREDNILAVVSKDEIPAKMQSFLPVIETRGVQRARLAITLNQQRKTGSQTDTGTVRDDMQ